MTKDLAGYLNQGVLNIAELEQKALQRYAAVTGSNYTSDESVHRALREQVLPLYRRFLDGLRDLRPITPEVRDLNRLYVQAAQSMFEGFKLKMTGIEQNDERVIIAGNLKIEESAIQTEKWRNELAALANKHDVGFVSGAPKEPWWEVF